MNKKLFVCDTAYSFSYDEGLNLWRVIGNQNLLYGYKIDLELDLNRIKKDIDWNELSSFIAYLQSRSRIINNNTIDKCKIALKGLFNGIYKDSLSNDVRANIDFELSGIDYRKALEFSREYHYDLFFFPYNRIDINMDMGSFVWRVKMRGNVLCGVDCDI